jgi:hypothetical protein
MTVIAAFTKCQVIEEAGNYRVMSSNHICLFQSANIVKAYEYAEWFQGR